MELPLSSVSPPVSTLGIWNLWLWPGLSIRLPSISAQLLCSDEAKPHFFYTISYVFGWERGRSRHETTWRLWLLWNTCSRPKLTLAEGRKEWMVATILSHCTVLLTLRSIKISACSSSSWRSCLCVLNWWPQFFAGLSLCLLFLQVAAHDFTTCCHDMVVSCEWVVPRKESCGPCCNEVHCSFVKII